MDTIKLASDNDRLIELAEGQRQFFAESELIKPLRAAETLLGAVALSHTKSPSLYKGFPADVKDNPSLDNFTVFVDQPTVEDLIIDHSSEGGLSPEGLVRLYIGTGIARMLIFNSIAPMRGKSTEKFLANLSESNGLYDRTMGSRLFDDVGADKTVQQIVTEGHVQTASVNALRLSVGMFLGVQPDAEIIRTQVEATFQEALSGLLDGREVYLSTVGLFDVTEPEAQAVYSNSVENMLALSFPMRNPEVEKSIKILR